jgi:tetratricopeptide (TPR) repeat protein
VTISELQAAATALWALGRLAEAGKCFKAGLDANISREDWKNSAISVSNLGELYLTISDIAQSLDYARKSRVLADRYGNAFVRMYNQTTLADALHEAGLLAEAEVTFIEAEEMQNERQPEYSYLYSVQGFRYCNLLLNKKEYHEVLSRAGHTLEWAKQSGAMHLNIALDHLSLGRAHLLQTQQEGSDDFSPAETHLNNAVEYLQRAGTQHYLPKGLLSRAELFRVCAAFPEALYDPDEAMRIAERGGMDLHRADCHLEYARLYLAMGEKEEDARRNLDTAKEMIGEMGYHRRDTDVREIEEKLS